MHVISAAAAVPPAGPTMVDASSKQHAIRANVSSDLLLAILEFFTLRTWVSFRAGTGAGTLLGPQTRRFRPGANAPSAVNDVETVVRSGLASFERGRYAEACAAFATALRSEPEHEVAALNFGILAAQLGEYGDAVAVLRVAAAAHPEHPAIGAALAEALRGGGHPDEAATAAAAVLARDPQHIEALITRGRLAYDTADFAGAERWFAAAARAAPQRYEPELNLAVLAHGLGQIDTALAHGRQAVHLAPNEPQAHVNLGVTHLLGGDFAAGFAELEWRLRDPRYGVRDEAALPRWHGERLGNGALLVTREQGFGDFVLWSRLFPLLAGRAARVAVECPPPLRPLVRDIPGIDEFIAGPLARERQAEFAAAVPLCSLPHVLGVHDPAACSVPYLRAHPETVARYRARFAAHGRARTIGIVWAGEPAHARDRFRSAPPAAFDALAGAGEGTWVSLQTGAAAATPPPQLAPIALGPELQDFGTTAAAIAALDLVITVDTAVAHVAGALGAPVWMLHGFGYDWLWGFDPAASPWYPTMRHFRQSRPNDWPGLFATLRAELERL